MDSRLELPFLESSIVHTALLALTLLVCAAIWLVLLVVTDFSAILVSAGLLAVLCISDSVASVA